MPRNMPAPQPTLAIEPGTVHHSQRVQGRGTRVGGRQARGSCTHLHRVERAVIVGQGVMVHRRHPEGRGDEQQGAAGEHHQNLQQGPQQGCCAQGVQGGRIRVAARRHSGASVSHGHPPSQSQLPLQLDRLLTKRKQAPGSPAYLGPVPGFAGRPWLHAGGPAAPARPAGCPAGRCRSAR